MNSQELQPLLDDCAKTLGVVGAQLAVYDGSTLLEFSTGYRDRELGLPVTSDTLFQIGSTTKVFNAALIMSLVDAGKLHLDTPVCQYVSDFKLADPVAQRTMTLRHLLSMTAGLDNGPYFDFGRGNDALGRYIDCLAGIPQIFAPGSAYGYSNASTCVAGHVASRVTGKTWEKLLTERIWAPLGAQHSALFAEDLLLHPVALGYTGMDAGSEAQRIPVWAAPRSLAPAGSLTCCSAGDLVRFGRLFLYGGKSADGSQLLTKAAVDVMQQPQVRVQTRFVADEWCVGPYRKKWDGYFIYGHSGTGFGGSSMLLWCPEKRIAIATVVNVPEQGYPLADAILDVVMPKAFGLNKPPAPGPRNIVPVPCDVQPYAGNYEAFGMTLAFEAKSGRLELTSRMAFAPETSVTACELIPLGEGRFFPCDPRVSANRNWDIAFWGGDRAGRATHVLYGTFPLRRTSSQNND